MSEELITQLSITPLVSVVIASYNKGRYIADTVSSVLNQTYSNWELIVVDDFSTDNSIERLQKYLSDNRISLVKNEINQGANFCRNRGIGLARGEYVIILDADDVLMPICIENRLSYVQQNLNYDLWVFPMGVFKKVQGDVTITEYWTPPKKNFLNLFLSNKLPWNITQPIWKRQILIELGGFDMKFQLLQDVELHTRMLINNNKVISFPNLPVDSFYRIAEERLTSSVEAYYSKWTTSAILYYNKFYNQLDSKHRKYLTGTLLQLLAAISYGNKTGKISFESYKKYKKELISSCQIKYHKLILRKFVFLVESIPFYLRGLNAFTRIVLNIYK